MSSTVFRRCGCRDDDGRQYGVLPQQPTETQLARACPKMSSDPKHGHWTYRISNGVHPVTGKRQVINGKAYASARAAGIALRKDLVAKDEKRLQAPTAHTLGQYAEVWLERRQTTGERPMKASTAAMYRRYLSGDIAPSALGHMKLSAIRRADVAAFVDALRKAGRGATTVHRILAVVQGVLSGAVKDELIATNVAHRIEAPTIVRHERTIWTPEEVGRFLQAAAGHRLGALFEVTLFAALRRGEVTGLRWADVDLGRGLLAVRNNRVKVVDGTVREQTTKTAASAATVALSDEAVTALRAWRLRQDLERAEWDEAWQVTGYVFTMEDGRPLDPPYVTRLFAALSKRSRVPATTLHGLRHIAATYMWEGGADIAQVSKALRHSNVGVTSTVYAHMRESAQRSAFAAIGKRLADRPAHTLHTQGVE